MRSISNKVTSEIRRLKVMVRSLGMRFSAVQLTPAAWLGTIGIAFSFLILWAGTAGAELFLQRISLIVMLLSLAIYFFGLRVIQFIAVPALLLLLAIPIPQIVFNKIASPLQLFAS